MTYVVLTILIIQSIYVGLAATALAAMEKPTLGAVLLTIYCLVTSLISLLIITGNCIMRKKLQTPRKHLISIIEFKNAALACNGFFYHFHRWTCFGLFVVIAYAAKQAEVDALTALASVSLAIGFTRALSMDTTVSAAKKKLLELETERTLRTPEDWILRTAGSDPLYWGGPHFFPGTEMWTVNAEDAFGYAKKEDAIAKAVSSELRRLVVVVRGEESEKNEKESTDENC